jgi:hypothetical protein
MMQKQTHYPPCRITDLVELKKQGADVTCQATFEIQPVEFAYHDNPYRAHIFLCMFNGTVNGEAYSFRKCYCRGCPNNLCPHVSQAVMIANRYLQRDYHRLDQIGIAVEQRLFSLKEMTVKYEDLHEDPAQPMTLHDLIAIVKAGQAIRVEPSLEWVSAVEHFANQRCKTIFLMANFHIDCMGKITRYERCLACYPVEADHEERQKKITIANQRLQLLYKEFEQAEIQYAKRYF